MKYKILLFDADETLFDFKRSEREALKNAFIDFNIDYKEDYHLKIYEGINSAIWREFEEGTITQENLKIERFKRLSKNLNLIFNEKEFAKCYMHHLSKGSFLLDNAEDLVSNLSKYYKLAIITNGLTSVQKNRIGKSKIAKYFHEIVISEEVSISKPNAEIFNYTLKKLNFSDKSKVLMIGDSLTSDIKGGINAGIDTCFYNPNRINNSTNIIPKYEANSFKDIINLLTK